MDRAGIGNRVEGFHAVEAAVAAGRVTELIVDDSRRDSPELGSLLEQADSFGVAVQFVDDIRAASRTETPQGLVAIARPIQPVALAEAVSAADPPALVVLDHLEDPRNVGAIARSAVAAGVPSLVVPSRRAAPLAESAFKAAAGALEHMKISVVSSVADTIAELKKMGVWTVGLAVNGEQSLFGLGLLAEPVALVVGSEGAGLSRLVKERLDVRAAIGLSEESESLNASVAAALGVYEIARMRGRLG